MSVRNILVITAISFIKVLLFLEFAFCQTVDLEKIVVVSKKFRHIKTIDSAMIDTLGASSLTDILNYSSGLDLQSRGKFGVQQDISLRGSTFQQVLVMIDGKRINDPQTAHFNLDLPISLEDVEYIEISPAYIKSNLGSDSIAGAINFVTKRPLEDKNIIQFLNGNHDTVAGLLSLSRYINNIGNRITIERSESDGFQPYTDSKLLNISNFTYFNWQDMIFDLGLGYNEKEFGAYDFYTPGKGYPSKEWTKTKFLSLRSEIIRNAMELKPNFSWREHNDKFMLDTNRPSLYLNHHRTDIYSFGLDSELTQDILGDITLGSQNTLEKLNSVSLGKYSRWQYAIFADDSKKITDNLDLGLGVRFDRFEEFKSEYSWSTGLNYQLFTFDIFCLVSRSVRIPSYTELFYNDSTTHGNVNLASEKAVNYEVGVRKVARDFSYKSSIFMRDEKDEIEWLKKPTDVKWQSQNIDAHVIGLESGIKKQLDNSSNIFLNYAYADKPKADGYSYKYGPSNASHLVSGGYDILFKLGRQGISFVYKKKPARNGWFLLNTNFTYEFNNNYKIFLQTENILNVEYEEIPGIPSPGRLLRMGLRLEW